MQKSKKHRVFVIGLSRTGTTSLTVALRILGYNTVHYPLGAVCWSNKKLRLNIDFVKKHDAITDLPAALFYRELAEEFPEAKFILTTRDTVSWIRSMRRLRWSYRFLQFIPKVQALVTLAFGVKNYKSHYESHMKLRFEEHNKRVIEYFATKNNLLILNQSNGFDWPALCHFLDCPIPSIDFPRKNIGNSTPVSNIIDFLLSMR